jgi:hypothetical protein
MKYSKERIEELKANIRKLVVIRERITCRQVAGALGIDRNFAAKLLRKVRAENRHRIENQVINEELGKIELHFQMIVEKQWEIISNNERKRKEFFKDKPDLDIFGKPIPYKVEYGGCLVPSQTKINAARVIRETLTCLFKMKLEAGVFLRKGITGEVIPTGEIVKNVNEISSRNVFEWQKNDGLKRYKATVFPKVETRKMVFSDVD